MAIGRTKELTGNMFGVNMRGDAPDLIERARLLVKHGVKVASFALAPNENVIRDLKDAGLVVVPSIGAHRHAEKVAAWGVDAVIVQGAEGGGHTGGVPTSILLPQVSMPWAFRSWRPGDEQRAQPRGGARVRSRWYRDGNPVSSHE